MRGENVGDIQRLAKDRKVRSEFEDVFNVKTDCGSAVFSYGEYLDDMNVAGSLSMPSSIKFLKK